MPQQPSEEWQWVADTAPDILPVTVGALWALAFLAIFAIHSRHALESHGQRRLWHSGHVLMGCGMVFMCAPCSLCAPVTWALAGYFAIQAWFWSNDWIRGADRALFTGTYTVGAGGEVSVATAEPLICRRDIRLSMVTITLGMAYMLVAMQLAS